MYKIIFNPSKCAWEIKLSQYLGLYWATLKGKTFPNYISAADYVQSVGLDQVYRNASDQPAYLLANGRL